MIAISICSSASTDVPTALYRNDGGTFTDVAATAGVADARPTRAAAWGDADADGDPDLLLGFTPAPGTSVLRFYRNAGGVFTDVTAAAGLTIATGAVRQPVWVDVDADGDLDLFVAFRDRANALFRNDAGVFSDVAPALGLADARRAVGAVWFDADEDGDLDLAVAHMDGDANALFRNDGMRFVDVAEAAGVAWGGRAPKHPGRGTVRVCAADVDADGRFDLLAANYGPLGLALNQGGGRFVEAAEAWGLAIDSRYDSCAPADIDHDGRLDLYVNGTVTNGVSWQDSLLRHTGRTFVDVTPPVLRAFQADHGVQWADVDGDGDLDLALTGARADGMHALLRNDLAPEAAARGLHVRAVDAAGRATLAGAEVRVRGRHRASRGRPPRRCRLGLRRAERHARARRRAGGHQPRGRAAHRAARRPARAGVDAERRRARTPRRAARRARAAVTRGAPQALCARPGSATSFGAHDVSTPLRLNCASRLALSAAFA